LSEDNKLSPAFESNLIYVKQQEDNFLQEIIDVFLHLRRTKIEEMIIEEQKKLNDPNDNPEEILEFIVYLNTKKLELAKQIGAVVTRY
jgi:hypothetical protein